MTELTWGNYGERYYETGVDRGVLYLPGQDGVVWNGLIAVNESPSGGEPTPYYLDGVKYLNRPSPEEYRATIEAYTYPDEFAFCDGSAGIDLESKGLTATQQGRKPFGFSYRTRIGNDDLATNFGYKLHIVYNALAAPSEKSYQSSSDDPEAISFSWDITTTPIVVSEAGTYSSHLVLDTKTTWPWVITAVEELLYGTEDTPPTLPTPQDLIDLFVENALLKITDNGDGTWTAEGPDEIIQMLNATEFQISWPSAVYLDEDTYTISSL
ncbi:major tail protein [Arthrobacter phage Qui]|jgi:hypothetical protein|uniref:Major tail protein n=1 Tax=Arthrobacter phage Qui TaxID=2603260 RepID=A0A5B8WGB6_9CAUD|nr:major tail protein [Arthrobacter phage Qui]QED11523.1 major tail protein [Arthrobacter phage Qui]